MVLKLSRTEFVQRFFSGTGFSYDKVAAICTCGFDILWKERIIAKIPPHPTLVIDQGCGTGILTFKIAHKFPDSKGGVLCALVLGPALLR